MTACVVDACTAIKLFLAEPFAAEAAALFGLARTTPPTIELHAPDLIYVECANILWKQTQRGNCTATHAAYSESVLRSLPIFRTQTFDLSADALSLALAHGISAYDACYVALASRLAVPLVTADQKLANRLAGTPLAPVWLGNWPSS